MTIEAEIGLSSQISATDYLNQAHKQAIDLYLSGNFREALNPNIALLKDIERYKQEVYQLKLNIEQLKGTVQHYTNEIMKDNYIGAATLERIRSSGGYVGQKGDFERGILDSVESRLETLKKDYEYLSWQRGLADIDKKRFAHLETLMRFKRSRERARKLLHEEQLRLRFFEKAISEEPDIMLRVANIYSTVGREKEAEKLYQSIIDRVGSVEGMRYFNKPWSELNLVQQAFLKGVTSNICPHCGKAHSMSPVTKKQVATINKRLKESADEANKAHSDALEKQWKARIAIGVATRQNNPEEVLKQQKLLEEGQTEAKAAMDARLSFLNSLRPNCDQWEKESRCCNCHKDVHPIHIPQLEVAFKGLYGNKPPLAMPLVPLKVETECLSAGECDDDQHECRFELTESAHRLVARGEPVTVITTKSGEPSKSHEEIELEKLLNLMGKYGPMTAKKAAQYLATSEVMETKQKIYNLINSGNLKQDDEMADLVDEMKNEPSPARKAAMAESILNYEKIRQEKIRLEQLVDTMTAVRPCEDIKNCPPGYTCNRDDGICEPIPAATAASRLATLTEKGLVKGYCIRSSEEAQECPGCGMPVFLTGNMSECPYCGEQLSIVRLPQSSELDIPPRSESPDPEAPYSGEWWATLPVLPEIEMGPRNPGPPPPPIDPSAPEEEKERQLATLNEWKTAVARWNYYQRTGVPDLPTMTLEEELSRLSPEELIEGIQDLYKAGKFKTVENKEIEAQITQLEQDLETPLSSEELQALIDEHAQLLWRMQSSVARGEGVEEESSERYLERMHELEDGIANKHVFGEEREKIKDQIKSLRKKLRVRLPKTPALQVLLEKAPQARRLLRENRSAYEALLDKLDKLNKEFFTEGITAKRQVKLNEEIEKTKGLLAKTFITHLNQVPEYQKSYIDWEKARERGVIGPTGEPIPYNLALAGPGAVPPYFCRVDADCGLEEVCRNSFCLKKNQAEPTAAQKRARVRWFKRNPQRDFLEFFSRAWVLPNGDEIKWKPADLPGDPLYSKSTPLAEQWVKALERLESVKGIPPQIPVKTVEEKQEMKLPPVGLNFEEQLAAFWEATQTLEEDKEIPQKEASRAWRPPEGPDSLDNLLRQGDITQLRRTLDWLSGKVQTYAGLGIKGFTQADIIKLQKRLGELEAKAIYLLPAAVCPNCGKQLTPDEYQAKQCKECGVVLEPHICEVCETQFNFTHPGESCPVIHLKYIPPETEIPPLSLSDKTSMERRVLTLNKEIERLQTGFIEPETFSKMLNERDSLQQRLDLDKTRPKGKLYFERCGGGIVRDWHDLSYIEGLPEPDIALLQKQVESARKARIASVSEPVTRPAPVSRPKEPPTPGKRLVRRIYPRPS